MFGHDSQPSRVYAYGAQIPKEWREVANDRLRVAHQYRNRLVELELNRRAMVDGLLLELSPDLVETERALSEAEQHLLDCCETAKKMRQQQQSRKDSPAVAAMIKAAREPLRELRVKRKELRADLFNRQDFKDRQDLIELDFRNAWKAARAECGLHCGHYLTVEQARGGDRSGAPPRFKRFEGDGKISVQIQKGGNFADAAPDTPGKIGRYLQVDPWDGVGNGKWRTGRIRIGSDEKRNPVWLPFRVALHRPVPADSMVKWAWLQAKRVAGNTKWSLQLVLARTEWEAKPCGDGVVAIMPGWSSVADGIQAATWVGSDGATGHIIIPNEQISRQRKCEDLQGIRDKNFNDIRERLGHLRAKAPDWFKEATDSMHQWRSEARLAGLVWRWKDNRFKGDDHFFTQAEAWRKQDKHLWEWQAHQRTGISRWRKDHYRRAAASLAERYGTAVIPAIDWRTFGRDAEIGEDDGAKKHAELRRLASVGMLVDAIKQRIPTETVDPAHIADTCGNCGEPWESHDCGIDSHHESKCLNLLRKFHGDDEASIARLFKARSTTTLVRIAAKGA